MTTKVRRACYPARGSQSPSHLIDSLREGICRLNCAVRRAEPILEEPLNMLLRRPGFNKPPGKPEVEFSRKRCKKYRPQLPKDARYYTAALQHPRMLWVLAGQIPDGPP